MGITSGGSRAFRNLSAALVLLGAASAASAQDVTITFNGASGTPVSYTESGLKVQSFYNGDGDHLHFTNGRLSNHDGCCSSPYVFTYNNGQPFSVIRVDVSGYNGTDNARWTSSSGGVFKFTNNASVNFPAAGWTNITSFQWDEFVGTLDVDNLVIRPGLSDTNPPVVSIVSPAADTCTNRYSANVKVDVTDASSTTVTATGSQSSVSLPAGGGTANFTVALSNEGDNIVVITAIDAKGNRSSATVRINRDTVLPTLCFTSPANGAVLSTATFSVSFSVSDSDTTTATFDGSTFSFPAGGGNATASYTAPSECDQTLTITATDCAGNVSSASITVCVDLSAPLITITSPSNGAIFGPTSNSMPITVTVDEACETVVASNPAGLSGNLPKGGGVLAGVVSLTEGFNTIVVAATDKAGNVGTASITVTFDSTPPSAEWLFPLGGEFFRGTVTISASAADVAPGSGISKVDVAVDGGSPATMTPDGNGYSFNVDTTTLSDGPHTFVVTATDGVGLSTQKSVLVIVDNTPPQVAVVAPSTGVFVCETVTFSASASDATSGLAKLTLYANGAAIATDTTGASFLSVSLNTGNYPDGPLSLRAEAVDHAGNVAVSQIAVTVDNTAPARNFLSPTSGHTVTKTITISATVTDANLASVEFKVDGVSLGVMTSAPFTKTFDTLTVLDGALTIELIATDLCDNVSTERLTVTVDNMSFALDPQTLNLASKGGDKSVTAYVEGKNVGLLLPTEANQIRLVLPDGSSVSSTTGFAGDDAAGDFNLNGVPDLTIKFDRQALIANIKAGMAAGTITVSPSLAVKLVAKNGKEIGTAYIKVLVK